MRRLILFILLLTFPFFVFGGGKTKVKGYYRKNGTYVRPHYRSTSSSSSSYKSSSSYSAPKNSVKVKGYYRKNGTYVRPHYRSKPDGKKSNNYGSPSYQQRKQYQNSPTLPTYKYDYDEDGIPNYLDKDSDNDGAWDDYDKSPYNSSDF